MKKRLVLGLALMLLFGFAQSQEPTLTPTKPREPPRAESKENQRPAKKDERGTEKSPLVIKGTITTRTKENSEREAEQYREKAAIDWGTLFAGRLTAAFTLVLAVIAIFQLWMFK